MNDDVDGILSETIKIRIDIDKSVVIPSVIFSSLSSLIEDELKLVKCTINLNYVDTN